MRTLPDQLDAAFHQCEQVCAQELRLGDGLAGAERMRGDDLLQLTIVCAKLDENLGNGTLLALDHHFPPCRCLT
jgi:hypothetical protein